MDILSLIRTARAQSAADAKQAYWAGIRVVSAKETPTEADAAKLLALATTAGVSAEQIAENISAAQSASQAAAFIKTNSTTESDLAKVSDQLRAFDAETQSLLSSRKVQAENLQVEVSRLSSICLQLKAARARISDYEGMIN